MYNQNWTLEWVSNRNRSEKSSRNVIIKAFSYSVKGLPQEILWSQSYQIRVTVGICDASGIWSRIDAFHFELPFASILFERSEFWILFIAAEGISCQILLSTEIRHNKMWTAQLRQMDVNQRCTCITLYPPPISKWCITFTGIIDNQSISMKPFHSFIINKNPRLVWHEVATHNHTHKRNQYSFPHRTFHALFQFDAWLLLMICPSLNCGSYFSLYISRSEPFDTCFHSVVSHMRFNIGTNVWSEKLKTIFWRRKCRLYFNKNERTPTHILLIMCTRSAAFRKYFFVLFFVPVLFVRKTARMNCAKNIIMERNRYRITERDKDSEKKRRSEKEVVRRARA